MNKRVYSAAVGAALLLLASTAHAAGAGLYVGVGAGRGAIADATTAQVDMDSNVFYSGLVGYRIGVVPLFDFAIEGQYTDFGDFKPKNSAINAQADASAFAANLLAILPIGPIDFYAKAGAAKLSFESTVSGTTTKNDSTNPMYGLGIGFRVPYVGVRLQADYLDTDKEVGKSLLMYSAIATFTF